MDDRERARSLGMSLDEFQRLVGCDPLDSHTEFTQAGTFVPKDKEEKKGDKKKEYKNGPKEKEKVEKKEKAAEGTSCESLHDEFTDVEGIGDGTTVPFETDEDVKNKTAEELEHYWTRPVTTQEDKALYYGYHIHSKDNMYGLHAHYPGGPLGGGHTHGPQNKLGYHTHRYSTDELMQFKFSKPGVMIQLDGPHIHQHNAPDGKHVHCEENFGPASGERNSVPDTN
jgi:hypothetical protein